MYTSENKVYWFETKPSKRVCKSHTAHSVAKSESIFHAQVCTHQECLKQSTACDNELICLSVKV